MTWGKLTRSLYKMSVISPIFSDDTRPFLIFLYFSQKKLVENMTREGTLADTQTDKIMKQHQKQVDKLNVQIDM